MKLEGYLAPRSIEDQRFRQELKYLLNLSKAKDLFAELGLHCEFDKHADQTKSYEIASTYYDTANLRFYWDRQESVGYRRKVRLRSYNRDACCQTLFVEIKERHKQAISKKRINLRDAEILKIFKLHEQLPFESVIDNLEDSSEARELAYLHGRLHLEPVVIVRYIRKALIPKEDKHMRITLDTRITAGGSRLEVYDADKEKFLLDAGTGIFEIKTDKTIPLWLQSTLLNHNLVQTRFSKYCLAVDAVYGSGKLWLPTKAEREESEVAEHKIAVG